MTTIKPDRKEFDKTVSNELQAIKDRVRYLIGDAHWLTDGQYKEEILIKVLRNFLPPDISVGTGFVVFEEDGEIVDQTNQIDIILYDDSFPVYYKFDNLVFLKPFSVYGIIEVKSKIRRKGDNCLSKILEKSYENALKIQRGKKGSFVQTKFAHFFNGLFAFDSDVKHQHTLNVYKKHNDRCVKRDNDILINGFYFPFVNNICINRDMVFYIGYHSIRYTYLEDIAPAFFIKQIIEYISQNKMSDKECGVSQRERMNYDDIRKLKMPKKRK